ncbi:hypothetical protein Ddc_14175 [Ditylenchus destructor]|nr:hypothetical protein Ddc_14175 [Ditylenchus destructor]
MGAAQRGKDEVGTWPLTTPVQSYPTQRFQGIGQSCSWEQRPACTTGLDEGLISAALTQVVRQRPAKRHRRLAGPSFNSSVMC